MSDYITGLRGDLVDAVDRHRRRSRLGTARRRLVVLPRFWRPALAGAAIAASVLAALVAASTLSPSPARGATQDRGSGATSAASRRTPCWPAAHCG